jgi:hypothetical protein
MFLLAAIMWVALAGGAAMLAFRLLRALIRRYMRSST